MIEFPSIRYGRPAAPLVLVFVTVLAGCASAPPSLGNLGSLVTPYRIDIIQGNVVTREQAQSLRPGMPRAQVRDILGTPLLASVFHADRWDYVFTFQRQGQAPQQRKLAVFFRGDVLERIEADELPTEAEFVASLDVRRRSGELPALQASEEQLRRFAESNRTSAGTVAPAVPAAPRSYPPLEAPEAER
ncbi:MAG: outer membrane protein assembly factor BamE [Burkholderiales bacterium]|nr:MAG: outer membrane protein assembly factor BamE [Burkholderiales bacterium]